MGLILSSTYCQHVAASGFSIIEHSASGMGNAFSGSAAASDASSVFFNPAGLTKIKNQLLMSGHYIIPTAEFSDQGSLSSLGASAKGEGNDGGRDVFVPNLYYSKRINEQFVFGMGVNAPYGLEVVYDDAWIGRYQAVESGVKTVNLNPSLAYQVNDRLSIGFGFNAQYVRATLSSRVDPGTICIGSLTPLLGSAAAFSQCTKTSTGNYGLIPDDLTDQSYLYVRGSDWSFGGNIGVLFDLSDHTRLGLAYRSKVSHTLAGTADFGNSAAFDVFLTILKTPDATTKKSAIDPTLFTDTNVQADVDLPETVSLNAFHQMNNWSLMMDITWTKWKRFDELRLAYDTAQPDTVLPQNWDNSFRYSMGAEYRLNKKILLRGGVALDETPIQNDADRTARIPDNDRTWISLGMSYQFRKSLQIDVGYAHLIVSDTAINHTDSQNHQLKGNYDVTIDILSGQFVWFY